MKKVSLENLEKSKLNINAYQANIYLFKVSNRSTRKRCEIFSNLTIKTPERRRSVVFIVNFENISHLFLVFLLLTLNKEMLAWLVLELRPKKL